MSSYATYSLAEIEAWKEEAEKAGITLTEYILYRLVCELEALNVGVEFK